MLIKRNLRLKKRKKKGQRRWSIRTKENSAKIISRGKKNKEYKDLYPLFLTTKMKLTKRK